MSLSDGLSRHHQLAWIYPAKFYTQVSLKKIHFYILVINLKGFLNTTNILNYRYLIFNISLPPSILVTLQFNIHIMYTLIASTRYLLVNLTRILHKHIFSVKTNVYQYLDSASCTVFSSEINSKRHHSPLADRCSGPKGLP